MNEKGPRLARLPALAAHLSISCSRLSKNLYEYRLAPSFRTTKIDLALTYAHTSHDALPNNRTGLMSPRHVERVQPDGTKRRRTNGAAREAVLELRLLRSW
jgi:hypothetical protein